MMTGFLPFAVDDSAHNPGVSFPLQDDRHLRERLLTHPLLNTLNVGMLNLERSLPPHTSTIDDDGGFVACSVLLRMLTMVRRGGEKAKVVRATLTCPEAGEGLVPAEGSDGRPDIRFQKSALTRRDVPVGVMVITAGPRCGEVS
jgi:hypothetical protein